MALPASLMEYLADTARSNGTSLPGPQDDLFNSNVLDSFSLVDFIAALEEHTGISVPDSDINPANFRTLADIESYVAAKR